MIILVLLLLLVQSTHASRIDRANDPTGHVADGEILHKPAVLPSSPHDPNRDEYLDCDWIDSRQYDSRSHRAGTMIPSTLENKPYALSPSQIAYFNSHGHVTLPRILTLRELNHRVPTTSPSQRYLKFGAAIKKCMSHVLDSNAIWGAATDDVPSFHRIHNMWRKVPFIQEIVTSPRLGQLAADLLGVKRVRLYQDSLFWKSGMHNVSRWHQDMVASPFHESTKMITLWMPLELVVNDTMGALRFAAASHFDGKFDAGFDSAYHGTINNDIVKDRYVIRGAGYLNNGGKIKRGDASFHKGYTIHGSGPNLSQKTRSALAIQWVAADDATLLKQEEWMEALGKTRTNDDVSGLEWMEALERFNIDHPFFPIVWDAEDHTAHLHARKNVNQFTQSRWVNLKKRKSAEQCVDDDSFLNYRNDDCTVYKKDGPAHQFCTRDGSRAYLRCAKSCAVLCGSKEEEEEGEL
jgi:hypothetical protein